VYELENKDIDEEEHDGSFLAKIYKISSNIKQQKLSGFTLYPTFSVLILSLISFASLLFFATVLLLVCSVGIDRQEIRYDDAWSAVSSCTVKYTPSEDMSELKIYYRLENFYGSHKQYVESRNYEQLRGETTSTSSCTPITDNKDISTTLSSFQSNSLLGADDNAIPCGLPAKYYFQDTFSITNSSGDSVNIISTDIALDVDKDSRFSNNAGSIDKQWTDLEDQRYGIYLFLCVSN